MYILQVIILIGFFLSVSANNYSKVDVSSCQRPVITQETVFIYQNIPSESKEIVYRCTLNDNETGVAYSDVTVQCLKAHVKGEFIDYLTGKRYNTTSPELQLESFEADGYPAKDLLLLPSGSICIYSMGFCYDSAQGFDYGMVWNPHVVRPHRCQRDLYLVYGGDAEFWTFSKVNLKYLVWRDKFRDAAFSLKIKPSKLCFKKKNWVSDERALMVTQEVMSEEYNLTGQDFTAFNIKSMKQVTQEIFMDCVIKRNLNKIDLMEFVGPHYLQEEQNTLLIMSLLQDRILEHNSSLKLALYQIKSLNKTILRLANFTIDTDFTVQDHTIQLKDHLKQINLVVGDTKKLLNTTKQQSKQLNQLADTDKDLDQQIKDILARLKNVSEEVAKTEEDVDSQTMQNLLINVTSSLQNQLDHLKNELNENQEKMLATLQPRIDEAKTASTTCLETLTETTSNLDTISNELTHKLEETDKECKNANKIGRECSDAINITNIKLQDIEEDVKLCLDGVRENKHESSADGQDNQQVIDNTLENKKMLNDLHKSINNINETINYVQGDINQKLNQLSHGVDESIEATKKEIEYLTKLIEKNPAKPSESEPNEGENNLNVEEKLGDMEKDLNECKKSIDGANSKIEHNHNDLLQLIQSLIPVGSDIQIPDHLSIWEELNPILEKLNSSVDSCEDKVKNAQNYADSKIESLMELIFGDKGKNIDKNLNNNNSNNDNSSTVGYIDNNTNNNDNTSSLNSTSNQSDNSNNASENTDKNTNSSANVNTHDIPKNISGGGLLHRLEELEKMIDLINDTKGDENSKIDDIMNIINSILKTQNFTLGLKDAVSNLRNECSNKIQNLVTDMEKCCKNSGENSNEESKETIENANLSNSMDNLVQLNDTIQTMLKDMADRVSILESTFNSGDKMKLHNIDKTVNSLLQKILIPSSEPENITIYDAILNKVDPELVDIKQTINNCKDNISSLSEDINGKANELKKQIGTNLPGENSLTQKIVDMEKLVNILRDKVENGVGGTGGSISSGGNDNSLMDIIKMLDLMLLSPNMTDYSLFKLEEGVWGKINQLLQSLNLNYTGYCAALENFHKDLDTRFDKLKSELLEKLREVGGNGRGGVGGEERLLLDINPIFASLNEFKESLKNVSSNVNLLEGVLENYKTKKTIQLRPKQWLGKIARNQKKLTRKIDNINNKVTEHSTNVQNHLHKRSVYNSGCPKECVDSIEDLRIYLNKNITRLKDYINNNFVSKVNFEKRSVTNNLELRVTELEGQLQKCVNVKANESCIDINRCGEISGNIEIMTNAADMFKKIQNTTDFTDIKNKNNNGNVLSALSEMLFPNLDIDNVVNRSLDTNDRYKRNTSNEDIKITDVIGVMNILHAGLYHNIKEVNIIKTKVKSLNSKIKEYKSRNTGNDQIKESLLSTTKNLKYLQNEVNTIKNNIKKTKEKCHKVDNDSGCRSDEPVSVKELKEEIQEMKIKFKQREVSFAASLSNVYRNLKQKDGQNLKLKKELNHLSQLYIANKNTINEQSREINILRSLFERTVSEMRKESSEFQQYVFQRVL